MATFTLNNYTLCASFWSQIIGALLKRNIDQPLLFVFSRPKKIRLHMFFVFCPITAYYLDEKNTVIKIHKLKPFQIATPVTCSFVVEVSPMALQFCKVGDAITWKNPD